MGTLARAWSYTMRPDVRRDPIRLVSRRLAYEVERRVAPGRLAAVRSFKIHDGLVMNGRLSDIISRSLYLYGAFEYASVQAFRQLLHAGDVVIDAGAHLGTYSLIASRIVGPKGKVVAFEPDRDNLGLLHQNIAANNATNVSVHGIALFDRTTELPLEATPWEENSGLPRLARHGPKGEGSTLVTCRPLDELLDELAVSWVDVMKVDVEGAEEEVFTGARRRLEEFRPDILFEVSELHDAAHGASNPAVDLLRSLGYEIFGIRLLKGRSQLDLIPSGASVSTYWEVYREPWQQLNLVARHPGRARRGRDFHRRAR